MALNHRPVFADKKVCVLCFIHFVVYKQLRVYAKSCRLSDRKITSVLSNI